MTAGGGIFVQNDSRVEELEREVARLRAERDRAWDDGHIAGREKSPTMQENRELRDRAEQAEARLREVVEIVENHLDAWPSLRLPLLAAIAAAQSEEPCKQSRVCCRCQERYEALEESEDMNADLVDALEGYEQEHPLIAQAVELRLRCAALAADQPDGCSCHSGSVCGRACAEGKHHDGCAAQPEEGR